MITPQSSGLLVIIKDSINDITNSEPCSFGGVINLVSEPYLIFLDELLSMESRNRRVRSLVSKGYSYIVKDS